jgi:hypothetical protein
VALHDRLETLGPRAKGNSPIVELELVLPGDDGLDVRVGPEVLDGLGEGGGKDLAGVEDVGLLLDQARVLARLGVVQVDLERDRGLDDGLHGLDRVAEDDLAGDLRRELSTKKAGTLTSRYSSRSSSL